MTGEAQGENRRKSERVNVAFTLVYNVDEPHSLRISLGLVDDIDALMVNLSDSGMGIITKHDLPIDTKLYIKFNIIDQHLTTDARFKHMEITAQVTSNVISQDVTHGVSHRIGMCFSKISSEDKIAISDFVKRNAISFG